MIVRFDRVDRPVNTLGTIALAELGKLLDSVETASNLKGLIFTSSKPDVFIAGADLFEIRQMNPQQMERYLREGQRLFDRIAALNFPTVAAINGQCLGGGLELALACSYRVASDSGSIRIGLPEVKLGLIPAWGGTTRLTHMLGPSKTLSLIAAGKTLPPRKAKAVGIIDEIVRPEALLAAAQQMLKNPPPSRRLPISDRLTLALPPVCDLVCRIARRRTRDRTFGNYPAPEKAIDAVRLAARFGHEAGLKAERQAIEHLVQTDATQNMLRLFFLRHQAKRSLLSKTQAQPMPVQQVAVIGGGTMGAGIVHALIRTGIPVRLVEVNTDAISKAMQRIKKLLNQEVRAKKLSSLEAKDALRHVHPTASGISSAGLKLADLVIEAVAERIDIKRKVFEDLDQHTRTGCVLASNTSSLSITDLAAATRCPQRVIGIHFFNPVNKMPLVEVVQTEHSSNEAIATGVTLATRIGMVPILVQDSPGFLVNRILIPYLAEAIAMASEGASVEKIDRVAKQWGMPMGPFELLDQIGLDIAANIFASVGTKLGDHIYIDSRLQSIITAPDRNWLGKKTGHGFYHYRDRPLRRTQRTPNLELIKQLRHHNSSSAIDESETITWRLLLPMINEAARVLSERLIDSADLIDIATVLGLGLAPFRGGLTHFTETTGLDEIVRQMDRVVEQMPEIRQRFIPHSELRTAAATRRPMSSLLGANQDKSQVASETTKPGHIHPQQA